MNEIVQSVKMFNWDVFRIATCILVLGASSLRAEEMVISGKDCRVIRMHDSLFKMGLKFEDGLVVPLAGDIDLLGGHDESFLLKSPRVTIYSGRYNLSKFWKHQDKLLEEHRREFGRNALYPGVKGVPKTNETSYVTVIKSNTTGEYSTSKDILID